MLCPLEIFESSPTTYLSWDTLGVSFSVAFLLRFCSLGPTGYILISGLPLALPMHMLGHFPTPEVAHYSFSLWELS